jgi:hypothetical protein
MQFRALLLGLRRFLTAPRDGLRLRGVVQRAPALTRAFVEPPSGHPATLAVDLDHAGALATVLTVLREVASKPYLPRILPPAPPDEFAQLAVDATAYLAWVGERARLTLDDRIDALLGDLVGDPAWYAGPEPAGGAGLPGIVGYIRTDAERLRLYVARGDTTLGLDLPLADPSGRPPPVRSWLAHLTELAEPGPGDSYCDTVVDLTGRA